MEGGGGGGAYQGAGGVWRCLLSRICRGGREGEGATGSKAWGITRNPLGASGPVCGVVAAARDQGVPGQQVCGTRRYGDPGLEVEVEEATGAQWGQLLTTPEVLGHDGGAGLQEGEVWGIGAWGKVWEERGGEEV